MCFGGLSRYVTFGKTENEHNTVYRLTKKRVCLHHETVNIELFCDIAPYKRHISTDVAEQPCCFIFSAKKVCNNIPEELKNLETPSSVEPSRSTVICHLSVRRRTSRPSSEPCGVVGEIGAAECWPPARQSVRPRHTFLIAHACLKCRIFSQAPAISGNRNKLRSRSHTTQRGKHTSINCAASRWVSYLNRNLVLLLEKHLKFRRKT